MDQSQQATLSKEEVKFLVKQLDRLIAGKKLTPFLTASFITLFSVILQEDITDKRALRLVRRVTTIYKKRLGKQLDALKKQTNDAILFHVELGELERKLHARISETASESRHS